MAISLARSSPPVSEKGMYVAHHSDKDVGGCCKGLSTRGAHGEVHDERKTLDDYLHDAEVVEQRTDGAGEDDDGKSLWRGNRTNKYIVISKYICFVNTPIYLSHYCLFFPFFVHTNVFFHDCSSSCFLPSLPILLLFLLLLLL